LFAAGLTAAFQCWREKALEKVSASKAMIAKTAPLVQF
jgi:hypothetical protein